MVCYKTTLHTQNNRIRSSTLYHYPRTTQPAMGNQMSTSVSTARVLAPTAFAVNFAAQLYGMLSSPNMKEIADRVSAKLTFFHESCSYYHIQYIESLRVFSKPDLHWRIFRPTDDPAACLDAETLQWRCAT
jgi:hypothetical protein